MGELRRTLCSHIHTRTLRTTVRTRDGALRPLARHLWPSPSRAIVGTTSMVGQHQHDMFDGSWRGKSMCEGLRARAPNTCVFHRTDPTRSPPLLSAPSWFLLSVEWSTPIQLLQREKQRGQLMTACFFYASQKKKQSGETASASARVPRLCCGQVEANEEQSSKGSGAHCCSTCSVPSSTRRSKKA